MVTGIGVPQLLSLLLSLRPDSLDRFGFPLSVSQHGTVRLQRFLIRGVHCVEFPHQKFHGLSTAFWRASCNAATNFSTVSPTAVFLSAACERSALLADNRSLAASAANVRAINVS